ncbi:MAG: hypothetical protein HC877_21045 [Thioploca sp.]|nr:hypothetical protein [Thioploca sp.]
MPSAELNEDTELAQHFAHHSLNKENGGQKRSVAHPTRLLILKKSTVNVDTHNCDN